jgi:hypothetical protein
MDAVSTVKSGSLPIPIKALALRPRWLMQSTATVFRTIAALQTIFVSGMPLTLRYSVQAQPAGRRGSAK